MVVLFLSRVVRCGSTTRAAAVIALSAWSGVAIAAEPSLVVEQVVPGERAAAARLRPGDAL